jgi:putative YpdA family bacillithiol system oxidoreductase
MESLLIYGSIGIVATSIVAVYAMRYRREHGEAVQRRGEARELGLDRPRGQYPFVDPSLCIGCGACVRACPEGDVLAVVYGTAAVVNGERCVGHGLCETACPVGALVVGMGDTKSRPDIPILAENFESNVPGLYLVGELGGMSLIRNAISQGRAAALDVVQRLNGSRAEDVYDLIIVGAGPAGISAALTAIEHNVNYLILEQNDIGGTILHYPHRKLVMTQPVEVPLFGRLTRDEYSKEELVAMWQEIHARFHLNVKTGERMDDVSRDGDRFQVISNGGIYRARFVILALGRRGTPRRLGVPGEEMSKVTYQLVDTASYTNANLLVVGGGDSAVEAAIGLAEQRGNTVTVSYRRKSFSRIKKKNQDRVAAAIARGTVKTLFESEVSEISKDAVHLTTPSGPLSLPNEYVFALIGGLPPFELLRTAGVQFGGPPVSTALPPKPTSSQPIHPVESS